MEQGKEVCSGQGIKTGRRQKTTSLLKSSDYTPAM